MCPAFINGQHARGVWRWHWWLVCACVPGEREGAHLSHADVGGELLVVPQLHDEHVCGGDLAERDRLLPHWVQRALLHRSLVGLLP